MNCPNCNTPNCDDGRFCIRCVYTLPQVQVLATIWPSHHVCAMMG
jgi:hypothetical protein